MRPEPLITSKLGLLLHAARFKLGKGRKLSRMLIGGLYSMVLASLLVPDAVADDLIALQGKITETLPELLKRHKTPGASVAVVDESKLVWHAGFGKTSADSDDPVTETTVFEACSMSKPVFGYAVLKLVEHEEFDLDRPLVKYLDQPYLSDEPLHKKITARMVLQHTTGFPNWRKGGWRAGGELPVKFEPGSKFGYSGEGFWYLQQVVEHQLDERMEPWIQRVLLQPLEMRNTSYVWNREYDALAAAGHDSDGNVKSDRKPFDRDNAAFSMYTTPTDYARFLIEIMRADRSTPHSISAGLRNEMLTPVVATDDSENWRGLGWVITKRERGSFVWHSGSNGTGFRCCCRFNPDTGRAIVIMTNAVGGVEVWKALFENEQFVAVP